MRRVLAIARLTFWEGIRMRIVLVFLVVLVFAVLRLPFALRGDDTLAGRLQSFLSYSLGALGLFTSLATVFLSCSTLANEIRNSSIHMVLSKPVSRFEVLAGKWLGVNFLNILLVVLCGVAIYAFALFIKTRPEQFRRDRLKLDDVVWTARLAAAPVKPKVEIEEAARAHVRQRIAEGALRPEQESAAVNERVHELETQWRLIKPGEDRVYTFENLRAPERPDTVVQVRFKARGVPLPPNDMLPIAWLFVDPQSGQSLMPAPFMTAERAGDMHQFLVAARPLVHDGHAALVVINPPVPGNRSSIHFEGEDSLQILYKVESFEANYVKALLMILFRLAFLSAVGLFFSVFVSFPVACLCALATYLIGLGWTWWWEAIGANLTIVTPDVDPFGKWGPYVRFVLAPILYVFPNFVRFDGSTLLVDGQYISYSLLAEAAARTLLFGGALLLILGWLVFRQREIAEVTI